MIVPNVICERTLRIIDNFSREPAQKQLSHSNNYSSWVQYFQKGYSFGLSFWKVDVLGHGNIFLVYLQEFFQDESCFSLTRQPFQYYKKTQKNIYVSTIFRDNADKSSPIYSYPEKGTTFAKP